MGLRLQINLIMGVLLAAFASLLIYLQLDNTRQSVREEMEGASIVATQLLSRLQAGSRNSSLEDMAQFLATVGRVRANEIEHVVFSGFHTNWCVESSARSAYDKGYRVIVASDCTATDTEEEQSYAERWIFPKIGRVMTGKQILDEAK